MTALNRNTSTDTNTTIPELYYAQPYDTSGTGFYFTDWIDFCEKINANHCEEFELQYINGDDGDLFHVCGIGQSNIDLWLDLVGQMPDHEKVSLYYLTDILGYSFEEAIEATDDYPVTEGVAKDYAEEYIESTGMLDALPEQLRYYFDVDAFARDVELNGDVTEFNYKGSAYTASR